ncbi:MAG TPA: thioredoxin-disulfide reductase [Alphaproteobacteria bacterium]|nr:thioredoxin-disulfide reductase [Alphaproteobacteria bacterium]
MTSLSTEVLIIGGGPAGYTAAIYAARANLAPIQVLGYQPGGQLMITTDVENYPGFTSIQGPELMQHMADQAEHVETQMIHETVEKLDLGTQPFKAYLDGGTIIEAQAIILATGAQAKWLGLDSEKKFLGYGVSGCATCDGFFFKGKTVAVVGGGNTAVEEALYLTHHANKVYLIHRRDSLRAEKIAQDRLLNNPKIEVIWNSVVEEVTGDENPLSVTGLTLKNVQTQEVQNLSVDGLFVAIGHTPQSQLVKDTLDLDEEGYILTTPGSTQTSLKGIFAAGDVQDKTFRQAITAAGQGCMAALEAERHLNSN